MARAAYATPCPWLPVDDVTAPAAGPGVAGPLERRQRAPELERPDRTHRLVLEPDLRGERPREQLGAHERRLGRVDAECGTGALDSGRVGEAEGRPSPLAME